MKKIAVIGGGIAGLTAAYLLGQRYEITLFERSERLGGNAYTLTTPGGEEVDIAAAVFGRHSYKNLCRLFKRLHIDTVGSFDWNPFSPSLGASFRSLDDGSGFFLSPGIASLISQRFAPLRPRNVRTLLQLLKGLKRARSLSAAGKMEGLSLGEALKEVPELSGDAKLIFVSCLCLISSMHCEDVLDAPAAFFLEKLKIYHDLVPPEALFSVFFPRNRTKEYIDALSAGFADSIVLNARVRKVIRRENDVIVVTEDGKQALFDRVVFGCNADQALTLLEKPTIEEKRLLGAWKYTDGRIVVHNDHASFPKRELMQGYTFLYRKSGRYIETSVSGSLWVLPGASKSMDLVSTQHPNFPIRQETILFDGKFRTPIFDFGSCSMIGELPSLNGVRNTYYCGSHFGFGLHEDAVTSAIEVAKQLGVEF
ncbi:MAG: hypothetical protein A2010_04575 [Nitrospirae bacterium GWD2_57_9]|nr:MAG: hypothetical protein A2010_04575 [Nitrospirae bacterium GWD2_57_9]OGW49821.1 MAG: hypothetical protein A2078_03515 [Nitrospirae bacterium GWC2_57_9]